VAGEMKEKTFVRFYTVNGKIEWERSYKDTLRAIYGDEVNDFISLADPGDFMRLSDDSIVLCESVKNRIDPDEAI
jgi:hypothetical protein